MFVRSPYTVAVIKVEISLSEEEYAAAKQEAAKLGVSLSELFRRSLRPLQPVDGSKPWMRYAGMVETGDPNASAKIDEVVYGDER